MQDFEGWYRRLHPRVLGVVLVACGRDDLAGDATDEAFVQAFERWDRVGSMSYPDAWVYRVAINAMKRRLRRRGLERRLLGREDPKSYAEAPVPCPELWREVSALPERQRLTVLLRYVADLAEAEVGEALGVTRGAVSASLSAARARLAARLADLDFADDVEAPHA